MRPVLPVLIALAMTAAVAAAQYKPAPAPPSGQSPGSVQVAPNPNIQITPGAVEDDLTTARRIPRDEAIKLVKEQKAIYIDVRSKDAYDLGHIVGAISIPESELIGRLKELPANKLWITYCA